MAQQAQRSDGWPTFLWISWTADGTEWSEPLCKPHRKYVFDRYPASARGQGRTGDHCTLCLAQASRTARLLGRRHVITGWGRLDARQARLHTSCSRISCLASLQ
jgi:hypothetical protein